MANTEIGEILDRLHPYCACGCGVRVKSPGGKYLVGHWCRTEEAREVLSRGPVREKATVSLALRWARDYDYLVNAIVKPLQSGEFEAKRLEGLRWARKNTSMEANRLAALRSDEVRDKISRSLMGRIQSEDTCARRSASVSPSMKRYWQELDDEAKSARVRKVCAKRNPSSTELAFLEFLDIEFPNKFRHNSRSSVVIGGKVPDFVGLNGDRKVIEVFGNFYHDPLYFPDRPTEEELIAHYLEHGYNCLVVLEDEVYLCDKALHQKLEEFIEGG